MPDEDGEPDEEADAEAGRGSVAVPVADQGEHRPDEEYTSRHETIWSRTDRTNSPRGTTTTGRSGASGAPSSPPPERLRRSARAFGPPGARGSAAARLNARSRPS